jgi:hypothetical protein
MIGATEDVPYAERELARSGVDIGIRAIDERVGSTFRQLGYASTPLLIVTDADGKIRWVSARPQTPSEEQLFRSQFLSFFSTPLPE